MPGKRNQGTNAPVDLRELGRRLRAARVLGDFESAEEVASQMGELGFEVSKQRLYAYERGDFMPPLDLALVLVAVLDPPGGLEFFRPAFRPDLWEKLRVLAQGRKEEEVLRIPEPPEVI